MTVKADIMMAGVGGQGIILASNILGEACLIEGWPVRAAETHGMAQRGGSVECHIRVGGIHGPLIAPGTADLLISFDLLEAARYSFYLKPGGRVVTNTAIIVPTSVFMQGLPIPGHDEILGRKGLAGACTVDAALLAQEAGSPLSQNVVMLGAAARFMPFDPATLREAVSRLVPKKTVETNLKAFALGQGAAEGCP